MSENLVSDDEAYEKGDPFQTGEPLEPEGGKGGPLRLLKWIFFVFVVIYSLLSYFHAPILTRLGEYLIVKHSPQESDLIVCHSIIKDIYILLLNHFFFSHLSRFARPITRYVTPIPIKAIPITRLIVIIKTLPIGIHDIPIIKKT